MSLLRQQKFMRNIAKIVHGRRLCSSLSATQIEYNKATPFEKIPGPRGFFELIRLFVMPGGKFTNKPMNELLQLLRKEYGDVIYFPGFLGQKPLVLTYKPEDAEKVFRAEGRYPYRRPLDSFTYYRRNYRQDIFKTSGGLTVEHGHEWHDFRTKVNQIMMQPKNTKMYIPKVDEVASDLVKKMRTIRDEKNEMPADFIETLNEWSLESIALIALDTRLNLLKGNNPEAKKLYELVKEVFNATYEFDIKPSIWRYYKSPAFKRAMSTFDEMTEIIYRYVNDAVERYKTPSEKEGGGVLEKLLKVDKNVAVIMAVDMLGAGIDTTSNSAVAILYSLAKNPDKQEILRKEIFQVLPSKDVKLDEKSLDNVPYLRAVIKESLRMQPIFGGNSRAAEHDLVLQGYQVPKGIDIMLVSNAHNENFDQVDNFIPERWLKANTDPQCPHAKDSHPFAFLPFGFASRACIGKRMANMELEIMVARVIREFKVEWKHPDLKWRSVTINNPDSPLKFRATDI